MIYSKYMTRCPQFRSKSFRIIFYFFHYNCQYLQRLPKFLWDLLYCRVRRRAWSVPGECLVSASVPGGRDRPRQKQATCRGKNKHAEAKIGMPRRKQAIGHARQKQACIGKNEQPAEAKAGHARQKQAASRCKNRPCEARMDLSR